MANPQFLNKGIVKKDHLYYDLYAISNHFGNVGFGHYTAYAKNHQDNQWYEFDDSRVTLIKNLETMITSAAYLLFYERRKEGKIP